MPGYLLDDDIELLQRHRERCRSVAYGIRRSHGSIAAYRGSLTIDSIVTADDPRLAEFYRVYESIFTLGDEREPLQGFIAVLKFNQDEKIQSEFGPFLESILLLRDPGTNEVVAAGNFAFYAYPELAGPDRFDASCQLNFLLVQQEHRGLGLGSDLLVRIDSELKEFAARHCGASRCFMTCEQNNPAAMTPAQIVEDARAALIDPYDRMDWWRRRGFRKLDFHYIQPPLSAMHHACHYLDYYARICDPDGAKALPAPLLKEHLRRFFFLSVGKLATDMGSDPVWQSTADLLSTQDSIALV